MTHTERRKHDRRQNNFGFIPGPGFVERRKGGRRGDDRFAATLKAIFDQHMEDTITDEQMQRILEPVLNKIRKNESEK